jgi:uncharacterized damage-inducible protein DinB
MNLSTMNHEMLSITEQLKDAYSGDPWFGRSVNAILSEIDETTVFEKPNGQHSILELLWHMITWKEFVLSRLRHKNEQTLAHFEKLDWRELDHSDKKLWKEGLRQFAQLQIELVDIIKEKKDDLLSQKVGERNYDFRKLLHGIIEHDIYHLGQIAYIKKLLIKV